MRRLGQQSPNALRHHLAASGIGPADLPSSQQCRFNLSIPNPSRGKISSETSPIAIVGAGLSGLTLGLCLKAKGIPAVIYDRASSSPRHNHGIWLRSSTCKPLLSLLHMDETTFREKLSVNSQPGSSSSSGTLAPLEPNSPQDTDTGEDNAFRCHRGRLEALLGADLSINWDHRLTDIQLSHDDNNNDHDAASSPSRSITLIFANGHRTETARLIGCDGPHSTVRQRLIPSPNPDAQLDVLPYVVFNGRRRLSRAEYRATLHDHMLHGAVQLHTLIAPATRLEIAIDSVSSSRVDISYTYSRPARTHSSDADADTDSNTDTDTDSNPDPDPLHRPNRPTTAATTIPEALYTELAALQPRLSAPFASVFDAARAREDRVLHWLMRCAAVAVEPDRARAEVRRLAARGVVLLGDAAHATPILGGTGANLAVRDGVGFAAWIAAHGVGAFERFAEGKVEEWAGAVRESRAAIARMHGSERALL